MIEGEHRAGLAVACEFVAFAPVPGNRSLVVMFALISDAQVLERLIQSNCPCRLAEILVDSATIQVIL